MPSPFLGMNPYLENPQLWSEVHSRLIIAIADAIAPQLRPKYRVAVEKRVYQMTDENSILVGIPDVVVGRSLTNTEEEPSNIAVVAVNLVPKQNYILLDCKSRFQLFYYPYVGVIQNH